MISMNEFELNELFNNCKPIDPLEMVNQFAVYSTFKNDVIFANNDIKNPIFCAGIVNSINQNVNNFNKNDFVGYLSFNKDLCFEISSNLIFKLSNRNDLRLIAILPYASFAMKLLRKIKPKIGQIILIIGLNFFSILLAKLIILSGSDVILLNLQEDFNDGKFFDEIDTVNFKNKEEITNLKTIKNLISNIIISETSNKIEEFLHGFNSTKILYTSKILPFDDGFTDPNYIAGIRYPYSYVRWHYQQNLKYFIRLVEKNIINIDFIKIEKLVVNSIEDIKKIINTIQRETLLFIEIKSSA